MSILETQMMKCELILPPLVQMKLTEGGAKA